jgi:hypothetical protein
MQIPVWLFLASILLALTSQDMASLLLKRVSTLSSTSIKASLPQTIHRSIPSFLNQHPNPQRLFSTTQTAMSGSAPFLEAVKNRRTIYQLKKESPISDAKIQEIVTEALLHVPSSFNSQSTRMVILLKEEHAKLWDIAKEVLQAIVPAEQYKVTEMKLNGFQNAYGTVSCSHANSSAEYPPSFLCQPGSQPNWDSSSLVILIGPLLRQPSHRHWYAREVCPLRR